MNLYKFPSGIIRSVHSTAEKYKLTVRRARKTLKRLVKNGTVVRLR
jgi:hypothetical protein